ncbi:hypothetical protein, partial [Microseira wollei]|uniref:hypothetical protein n=1 Tax=Microseira wollei TaxID=467598 RepID=UPI001CFC9AFF
LARLGCPCHKRRILLVGWASCPPWLPMPQEKNFACGVGILPALVAHATREEFCLWGGHLARQSLSVQDVR